MANSVGEVSVPTKEEVRDTAMPLAQVKGVASALLMPVILLLAARPGEW